MLSIKQHWNQWHIENMPLSQKLEKLHTCREAILWASAYGSDDLRAWEECPHGDWLLWITACLTKVAPGSKECKQFTLCALDCVEIVTPLWPQKYRREITRQLAAIRKWVVGRADRNTAVAALDRLQEIKEIADRGYIEATSGRFQETKKKAQRSARINHITYTAFSAKTIYIAVEAAIAALTAEACIADAATNIVVIIGCIANTAKKHAFADITREKIQLLTADIVRRHFVGRELLSTLE